LPLVSLQYPDRLPQLRRHFQRPQMLQMDRVAGIHRIFAGQIISVRFGPAHAANYTGLRVTTRKAVESGPNAAFLTDLPRDFCSNLVL